MASLMATFLTLWAGSIFNTRPRCENPLKGEGSTLVWCDALSVTVGLVDIFVLAAIGICFVYMKVTASRDALVGDDGGGDVEMVGFENPMREKSVNQQLAKKKRDTRMKKVRQKLSIGAKVKRESRGGGGGGGGGGSMGGEVTTNMGDAESVHVDVATGRQYSYNIETGQTEWLAPEDGGATNGGATKSFLNT